MDLDGIVVGDIRSYVIFRSFPNPVSTAPSEPFFPAFAKLIGKLLEQVLPAHEPEADDSRAHISEDHKFNRGI